jgi:L-ascorbate metabolism protein UlaG (beta-lactamase superfamily)
MLLQLARHATLLLTYANVKFLVDPMLSEVGVNPPIPNTPNELRNPLVPLALPLSELLDVDAYLITHTHRDHFDEAAADLLPKHLPLFCQPPDSGKFRELGFQDVRPIEDALSFQHILLDRTCGQHGTGAIAVAMAPVSGFVLRAPDEPTLYLAGDTIWCPEVRDVLDQFQPDIAVVNAGGARFNVGDPITMHDGDIAELCRHAPSVQIVAVHLDSINHCLQKRPDLQAALQERRLSDRVQIPEDGETLVFEN